MVIFYNKLKITTLIVFAILAYASGRAQCPHVFDFYGQVNDNPYWYSCSGNDNSMNLSTPDTWNGFSIDWGDGSPVTSGASWAPPTFQNHVYLATVDTFIVTITETSSGCVTTGVMVMEEATSASIQIPVGGLTQACAPQMMEFINSSTNVSETSVFTWDFGDGSPILTFDYTNWLQTIQHTYEIGTVTCETVVTLTAENYCNVVQGGNSTATFDPIRIWDLDDPAITASATLLCYPDTTVTFMNTTYRNCLFQGNIYQRYEWWNFGDYWGLGYDSIIDWTPWPPTFPHTMHYPGIGTYTVQLLDSNYCGIAPTSITIQIVPPPVAGIMATPDTVCVGEPIAFLQQATGGANMHKWNMGDGNGWFPTGAGNITYIFSGPGTYNVGSMVGISGANGCTDTAWVQVVVLPSPAVDIAADFLHGCDSLTVDFSAVTPNAVSWDWSLGASPFTFSSIDPPLIDYNVAGDYNVTLTVANAQGCSATDQLLVQVHTSPVVDFNVFNLCEGEWATFNDLTTHSINDSIVSWTWDFGDATTSNDAQPDHLYTTTGTFDVTLNVVTEHCFGSDSMSVTVEDAPAAAIEQDVFIGCGPLTVNFTNNSDSAFVYHWTLSDGFETEDFELTHTFLNTSTSDTTYMITLTALNAFGCGGTDTVYVTVHPGSVASFLDNSNPPGCSPFAAFFTNTSQNATSYLWDLGDGTTSNLVSPTNVYINTTGLLDTYDITLIAYNNNGCNDTTTHTIIVYPLADFDFTISGSEGCAPLTATMPFISGVQAFNWDFGDGSTSPFGFPTHTFNNNSDTTVVYDVTLIGSSAFGCTDTATTTVTVYSSPFAQFSADVISGCGPLEVSFTNMSIFADLYEWNYGDGTTSNETDTFHTHVFTNSSNIVITRTVTLTATTLEGCTSQFSLSVQIYPEIQASFLDPGDFCSPANFTISNTSINVNSFSWDFGNGLQSILTNPTVSYTNNSGDPVVYDIVMMATSMFGCTATATQNVIVNPTPIAEFATEVLAGCAPLLLNIINSSINADSLHWDYGDGTTSNIADSLQQHLYQNNTTNPISFDILLTTVSDEGCSSQYSAEVTVYPAITASFVDPGTVCSPATILFASNSINAASYQWDFGNGLVSVMEDPISIFSNDTGDPITFNIMLVATSSFGCTDTVNHDLILNPTPVAAFTPNVFAGCSPLTVSFENNSVFADINSWDYDDGITSNTNDTLHQHTFTNTSGMIQTFDVVLTTTSLEGCSDQIVTTITVYPEVVANFGDPGIHCSPVTIAFINNSIGAVSYSWDFGNGLVSALANPTSYFTNNSGDPIIFDVQLIATSIYGCSDTTQHDLLINPTPIAGFTTDVVGGCSPLTVNFTNTSLFADSNSWSYGDGNTSTNSDVVHSHIYINNTSSVVEYVVMLTTSSIEGCSAQSTRIIQVYPQVSASFMNPGEHCSPVNVSFNNTSENGVAYNWDFGNGVQSIMENPTIYFVNSTDSTVVYNVQLLVSSSYGCDVLTTMPLTIHPTPVANFTLSESAACVPSPVMITNTSTVAASFVWNYGDGTTSQDANAQHIHDFAEPLNGSSDYVITLTAISNFGCVDTSSAVFSLYPAVQANFQVDTIGCSPFNAFFMNQSVGAVAYEWSFGDAQVSQLTSPSHIYTTGFTSDTVYEAQLVAINLFGCTDTLSELINVKHTPQAILQIDTTMGCYPTVVRFYNGSIGAYSYLWSYGTGQTSTTTEEYHEYEYVNVTNEIYTYQISLHAYSDYGCMSSANLTVDIAPEITADFYSLEEGCSPLEIFFDNTSDGGDSYFWDFGDGDMSNEFEPHHTFFNWSTSDTSYTVTYVLYDSFGCPDTATTVIYVYANPLAGFDVSPSVQLWPSATITLDNTTIGGALTSTWNMNDGTFLYTAEPGTYTYETWGEYNIQLIVSNGSCSDTIYHTVEILPPSPEANFEGPAEGCAPLSVSFTNLSLNYIASNWTFGDGGAANATNPVYTYWQPGTYTVALTVLGPDGTTDQMVQEQIIHVYPRAQAAFTITPNEVNVPGEPVYCLNLSTNANSYEWSFGDGNTSTQENPLYYYQEEGSYTIQLVANNEFGCPDTMVLPDIVSALASGLIDFPNAFSPNPNSSSSGSYDANSFDNDVFFPIHNGVSEYQLQIFNKWGEMLFESNDVNRGWDGYYRGSVVKQDVYVWKVKATFIDGQHTEQSGDVTVIIK